MKSPEKLLAPIYLTLSKLTGNNVENAIKLLSGLNLGKIDKHERFIIAASIFIGLVVGVAISSLAIGNKAERAETKKKRDSINTVAGCVTIAPALLGGLWATCSAFQD